MIGRPQRPGISVTLTVLATILTASIAVAPVSAQGADNAALSSGRGLGDPDASWTILWSGNNEAMIWRMNGSTFVGAAGFKGPGQGWIAQGYDTHTDGTSDLLWAKRGGARIWHLNLDGTFRASFALVLPDTMVPVTVQAMPDGGHNLVWRVPTEYAFEFCHSAESSSDGEWLHHWDYGVYGATFRCLDLKHFHDDNALGGNHGKTDVLSYSANDAQIGTSYEGRIDVRTAHGPVGSTATAFMVNADGTFVIAWKLADGRASVRLHGVDGKFVRQVVGLRGPSGMTITGLDNAAS